MNNYSVPQITNIVNLSDYYKNDKLKAEIIPKPYSGVSIMVYALHIKRADNGRIIRFRYMLGVYGNEFCELTRYQVKKIIETSNKKYGTKVTIDHLSTTGGTRYFSKVGRVNV